MFSDSCTQIKIRGGKVGWLAVKNLHANQFVELFSAHANYFQRKLLVRITTLKYMQHCF